MTSNDNLVTEAYLSLNIPQFGSVLRLSRKVQFFIIPRNYSSVMEMLDFVLQEFSMYTK